MHTLLRAAALAVAAALAGCTYPAPVKPVTAPADMFPADTKQIVVSQYFEPELAEFGHMTRSPRACSPHRYPVRIGPALVSSLRAVNEAAFRSVGVSERKEVATASAQRHIAFERVTSRAHVNFRDSLWTVHAGGFVELIMRVTVYDGDRNPLWMDLATGVGRVEGPGADCERGAKAVGAAAEEAIREAVDEYVEKIIKAGRVDVSTGA